MLEKSEKFSIETSTVVSCFYAFPSRFSRLRETRSIKYPFGLVRKSVMLNVYDAMTLPKFFFYFTHPSSIITAHSILMVSKGLEIGLY